MNDNRLRGLFGALFLLGMLASVSGHLLADDKPPAATVGEEPRATTDFRVYALKHASASQVAGTMQQFFGSEHGKPVRIVADHRTNSLLVSASEENARLVKRLLETLDVDADNQKRESVSIVELHSDGPPDQAFEKALRLVLSRRGGSFAVDQKRNAIILQGDEALIATARQVIARLDQAREKPRPQEMQVRVVWLASGLTRKDTQSPPSDLREVVEELARIGVENPRLVSQTLVHATASREFNVQGRAILEEQCNLTIEGMVGTPNGAPVLDISISAKQAASSKATICQISTQIAAPLGHSVVLGVTPTDKLTSVFVVQILPKKESKAPRP